MARLDDRIKLGESGRHVHGMQSTAAILEEKTFSRYDRGTDMESVLDVNNNAGSAQNLAVSRNAMTVDVEDYFHVAAFENNIARDSWNKLECRVQNNVDKILRSFAEKNVKGTFFTLGWVGERYPEMLRRIVAEGHELASHGWDHIRLFEMTPGQFRADVIRAKEMLEQQAGVKINGYRAPCYSVAESNLWVHDILLETGHTYSSSIAPIKYKEYGLPNAPRFSHYRRAKKVVDAETKDSILEIPITTIKIGNRNFPCGGGGWFRLYPYRLSQMALSHVNRVDKEPCVFYYHPWEIDVDQPIQKNLSLNSRFRHYQNLSRMEGKVDRLMSDFSWHRMDEVFDINRADL